MNLRKVAIISLVFSSAAVAASEPASARNRLYPVTTCGPDQAYLCKLHGSFDDPPFHYNLAIHPGCIKTVSKGRRYGREYVIVCGSPERPMVWW
ncbi:hypothetical protein [Rhodopseudomonas palustris]|uniref:Uncharacterized protein n=1 Tax=Rhodopseudomonas palustris (strain DX-1) TaxID=652103 RepID=E6VP80_RHOPX|nr:hypothetical protein [Rhodopseudomonas palustris]QDL98027.1 hypothetical protein FLL57_12200 [Rhodopseudomonas palustris]